MVNFILFACSCAAMMSKVSATTCKVSAIRLNTRKHTYTSALFAPPLWTRTLCVPLLKSAFTVESPLNSSSNAPSETGFQKGVNIAQNDEYGRLRRQHPLHKHVMNDKLIQVPFPASRPIKILDSATGDGLWMLDAWD
jgi:hypothetical protein